MSDQHPDAKRKGITAGPITRDIETHDVKALACNTPNRQVMADALNTMNRYGKSPSEMVELLKEAMEVLRLYNELSYNDLVGRRDDCLAWEIRMDEFLDKLTEDFR